MQRGAACKKDSGGVDGIRQQQSGERGDERAKHSLRQHPAADENSQQDDQNGRQQIKAGESPQQRRITEDAEAHGKAQRLGVLLKRSDNGGDQRQQKGREGKNADLCQQKALHRKKKERCKTVQQPFLDQFSACFHTPSSIGDSEIFDDEKLGDLVKLCRRLQHCRQ